MSRTTIQTYVCSNYNCRHVEERAEGSPYGRQCPICGNPLRHVGTRTVER